VSTGLGHRERVLRTLEHRDIDRIPFFFRAETLIRDRLKKKYGLETDLDLISYFDADAIEIHVPYLKESLRKSDEEGIFYDMFGNKIKSVQYDGICSEAVVEPVLAHAEKTEDIYRIKWPDSSFIDFEKSKAETQAARATGLAVYSGVWASIFTNSRAMLGEEKYLISLVENPEFIDRLLEKITGCFLEMNEAYLSACSDFIDIYYYGSDFGTQNSMFISPDMFRRFFKPNLKKIADQAKDFGLKVMYHTCGAVSWIIPDLIECGIDILDPVQVSAAGMAPALLAEKFKGRIAFHGGISTQTTLPHETPEIVRKTVIETIETLGPLGYIAAPDQDMIGDIPAENIETMFRTIREYKI
jgi:uroporphyrinogen decarboxylase